MLAIVAAALLAQPWTPCGTSAVWVDSNGSLIGPRIMDETGTGNFIYIDNNGIVWRFDPLAALNCALFPDCGFPQVDVGAVQAYRRGGYIWYANALCEGPGYLIFQNGIGVVNVSWVIADRSVPYAPVRALPPNVAVQGVRSSFWSYKYCAVGPEWRVDCGPCTFAGTGQLMVVPIQQLVEVPMPNLSQIYTPPFRLACQ